MQYYWHAGLVLGIVAVAFLALAFRCHLWKGGAKLIILNYLFQLFLI
jgi:hypothetical protein